MGIVKIRLILKAYDSKILVQACNQLIAAIEQSADNWEHIIGPVPLPTKRRIYCVLRSPHVNKDSREHFEIRIHKRLIDIVFPEFGTIARLHELDIPSGIGLQVKTFKND